MSEGAAVGKDATGPLHFKWVRKDDFEHLKFER